jgi:alpha-galactosidase
MTVASIRQRSATDGSQSSRDDSANLDIDVSGARVLSLLVDDGGDGGYNDRADWAELHVDCA